MKKIFLFLFVFVVWLAVVLVHFTEESCLMNVTFLQLIWDVFIYLGALLLMFFIFIRT